MTRSAFRIRGSSGPVAAVTPTAVPVAAVTPAVATDPNLLWEGPATITWGTSVAGVLKATESTAAAADGTITYSALLSGVTSPITGSLLLPVGTYTLTATYTSTDGAFLTSSVQSQLTVVQENQEIEGLAPVDGVPGQLQVLSAVADPLGNSAPSGEAVAYQTSGGCISDGYLLLYTALGTCTVTASVPGDSNYAPTSTTVTSNVT